MATAKQVMIFIVEGPTEETALAQILSRIFSTSQIKFEIVHGDITIEPYNHVSPATRGRVWSAQLSIKNGASPRCRQSNALRGCLGFQGVRKAGRRRPCRCRLELKQPVLEAISICWRLRQ